MKNVPPLAASRSSSSFWFWPSRLFSPRPVPPPTLVGGFENAGALTQLCFSSARVWSATAPRCRVASAAVVRLVVDAGSNPPAALVLREVVDLHTAPLHRPVHLDVFEQAARHEPCLDDVDHVGRPRVADV